jgi:hypothetical protein
MEGVIMATTETTRREQIAGIIRRARCTIETSSFDVADEVLAVLSSAREQWQCGGGGHAFREEGNGAECVCGQKRLSVQVVDAEAWR